jgi:lipopolysaccharide/colanic/teichoic acid biosynthesis glycosyltransferase
MHMSQHSAVGHGQAIPLAGRPGGAGFYLFCKRVVDLAIAVPAALLLLPLAAAIALLIRLDSPGPAIFVQTRVGARRRVDGGRVVWDIRPFRFYKFRTMVDRADDAVHREYTREWVRGRAAPSAGGTFKLTADPRVTRVGRMLRRTSLDELPQVVNVLKGEMSLVGPRPVPLYEVEGYEAAHYERLAALPGITGLWQVRGRCQVPFEQMIRLDIEYVRRASLLLDLKILLLTIPAVISARGAD